MNQVVGRVLAALAVSIVLVGVGAWIVDLTVHEDRPATSASGTPGATTIAITNFAFDPPTVALQVGDTVEITNDDDAEHTFTSGTRSDPTGLFDEDLPGGQTATVVIDQPGEITYFCAIHPGMKGTFEVAG